MLTFLSLRIGGQGVARPRVFGGRKIRAAGQAVLLSSLIVMGTGRPRLALARLGDWKPVLAGYEAQLTLKSTYTTNDRKNSDGLNDTTSSQALRESLTMATIGYVFHPDLMLFKLSGTYGEDKTSVENVEQTTVRGGYEAYELRSMLFRAKPYTMDIYTKQDKPFNSLPTFGDKTLLTRESGADAKYKSNSYKARLKYKNKRRLTGESTSFINDYDSYCDFTKPTLGSLERFMVNAVARYQEDGVETAAGAGGKSNSQTTSLSNTFAYSIFNFSTGLNFSTAQLKGEGGFLSDTLGVSEGIRIRLPWNFDANFQLFSNTGNVKNTWTDLGHDGLSSTAMESSSSTQDEQMSLVLKQKLFESLSTELKAEQDTMETSRVETGLGSTGNAFSETPVNGGSENKEYGLTTQYTKSLPRGSTVTGTLSTEKNQVNRAGLSAEPHLYPSVPENGGIITLGDSTDTEASIVVEVLRSVDTCQAALRNPRAVNSCWVTLVENVDYELNKARREITIGNLSDGPLSALEYQAYKNDATGTFGPFPFRVTSYLKAANATTQGNTFGVGLTLFQFVSSTYQHSVVTQEGTYAGTILAPTVTSDALTLDFSLYSVRFGASRRWTQTSAMQTITDFRASYGKSKTFWQRLKVDLGAEANKGIADYDGAAGDSSQSTEDGYSYMLDASMPLPYIKANVTAKHSYSYSMGAISRLVSTSDNTWVQNQDTGIRQMTRIRNSINLTKPFKIPWINFGANTFVRYQWLNTTGDTSTASSTLHYGVNAARTWLLGATSINLGLNYSISSTAIDAVDVSQGDGTVNNTTYDQNSTSVSLTVIRQLF